MNFQFTDEQEMFQRALRDFLDAEFPPARVRELWEGRGARELAQKLAELGVSGLLVPEALGGLGRSELDAVLPLEEMGRAGIATPTLASAFVAAPLLRELAESGDAPEVRALAERWLPNIADGSACVAVGLPGARYVENAQDADLLLLASGADEVHAVTPDACEITPQRANDPARRIARVRFAANAKARIATGEAARASLAAAEDRGALASAAQAIGACARMLDLAVAYTTERKQFGKPVGAFQAVKHHLANVKVKLEYARPLVYRAAHSIAHAHPLRALHVSMAKLSACEAALFAAKQALQCHGAIGYTWEQDLHIFMRRAQSLDHAFGRAAFHLSRVRRTLSENRAPLGPGATFATPECSGPERNTP